MLTACDHPRRLRHDEPCASTDSKIEPDAPAPLIFAATVVRAMLDHITYTDQTHCYDESGIEIPCAGSGQDAEFKTDHQIPAERFQVMTDVVLDSLTGLTWCRNANPAEFPLDWQAAHDFINEMNGVRGLSGAATGGCLRAGNSSRWSATRSSIPPCPKIIPSRTFFPGITGPARHAIACPTRHGTFTWEEVVLVGE